jgi:hypothetical protein
MNIKSLFLGVALTASSAIASPEGYKLRNLYDFLTVNNFPTSNYTTNYTGKFYPQYTHSIELEGKKIEATIATLDDVFPPYPSLKFVVDGDVVVHFNDDWSNPYPHSKPQLNICYKDGSLINDAEVLRNAYILTGKILDNLSYISEIELKDKVRAANSVLEIK